MWCSLLNLWRHAIEVYVKCLPYAFTLIKVPSEVLAANLEKFELNCLAGILDCFHRDRFLTKVPVHDPLRVKLVNSGYDF